MSGAFFVPGERRPLRLRETPSVIACLLGMRVLLLALMGAASVRALPPETYRLPVDWHLDATPYAASAVRNADGTLTLSNGLIRRVIRIQDGCATVALDDLMTGRSLLRSVRPEALVTINGREYAAGGLLGQPNHAFLAPEWLAALKPDPKALRLVGVEIGQPEERLGWKRVRHHAPGAVWPPKGVAVRLDFAPPDGQGAFKVSVHYELYDGIPVWSKWLTVTNGSDQPVRVDRFTSELLAVIEQASYVETRGGVPGLGGPFPDCLQVETDQAFGSFNADQANRHVVHWEKDPLYATQVNYLRETPCLLRVSPFRGPAQDVAPGATFATFRAFGLVQDSSDRERRGLAQRRMYRVLAPWVTENPLMHHLLASDPATVRKAVDQAAEVGFEMIILSFGSGFNTETDDPAHLRRWAEVADYARSKGVDLGSYSLLSSRKVGGGNDVVPAPGESTTFGHAPALTSPWGREYFRKLRAFLEGTGFGVLEHDGSYPGDWDVTARPPLQRGLEDSQWAQWRIIDAYYRWCRGRGVYLNVPDYYFLAGSSKCGMGYREDNWSLPRAQQVIHTRQNIHDGTWDRTPSMGWMFVPLSQYHGGGAAATIEPLDSHLGHYQLMVRSNLSAGVQACYRGPRLFDTPRVRDMLKAEVDWFKAHRDILESDVIHLRRPDGLDWDGLLHVNPGLAERGLLTVFNPTDRAIEREILVPLYYSGLSGAATVRVDGAAETRRVELDSLCRARIRVAIPPSGQTWVVFTR